MKSPNQRAYISLLRIGLLCAYLSTLTYSSSAQESFSDSLNKIITKQTDAVNAKILSDLFYKYETVDYHKASIAGNLALPFLTSQISKPALANFYVKVGQSEYTFGNHEKALQLYLESANIGKKYGLPKSEAAAYNEIAVLHRKNKNLSTSKIYSQNALKIFQEQNDSIGIATSICNLGINSEVEGDVKKALEYYFKALDLYGYINIDLGKSYCLDYIAGAYRILNKLDSALYFESKSLALRRKLDNKYAIAQSLMTMGEIHFAEKEYVKAIQYFEETAQLCNQIGFIDYERTAYENLAESCAKLEDFGNAYRYKIKFNTLNDSLFNEKRAQQISELETRFQTQKKESEIKAQQLQIQKRNYLLVASVLLLLIIIIGSYFLYNRQQLKQQQRQEKIIWQTEEKQRISMAKDIHDDLGSGLSKINFLANDLIKQIPENLPVKNNITAITDVSKNLIDNMRDMVWQLNAENNGVDNLAARIREYATDYLEDFQIQLQLNFPAIIPETTLSKISHRQIFLTIKEALHNIVKHANANLVTIELAIQNDVLIIRVMDDGNGFALSKKSNGNGIRNMYSRMQNIAADYAIISDKNGTTITIKLLLSKRQILL